jgi:hypothetical protein
MEIVMTMVSGLASKEINEMADNIIYQHMPELLKIWDPQTIADNQSRIAIIFIDKEWKSGGRRVYGKVGKISEDLRPLLNLPSVEFLIKISQPAWNDLHLDQQKALLFHHFRQFAIVENEQTGDMKVQIVRPDISYFFDELQIFGHWRPVESEENGGGPVPPEQHTENVEKALGI